MDKPWFAQRLRQKPDKAVVRLFRDDGTFLEAVNVPTDRWPLNAPYEAFHCNNCTVIEDKHIAKVVDAIPYRIGHCYGNSENVALALQAAGYHATQYVGWMFVGEQYPIHHSWVVLGEHLIDLADEFSVLHYNQDKFEGTDDADARSLLVEFTRWIRQFPNSKRTMPFGIPSSNLLYVGCPCSREEGIHIYNNLSRSYPNHPCNERLVKGQTLTKQQLLLKEAGLMD